ncbi:MAG: ATP-binding protein, partial [Sorangiineae bacterium]|nr:ATP-binding protein [Sorangiineae bacterium]
MKRLEAVDEPLTPEGEAACRPESELAAALHEVSNALTVVLGWLDAAYAGLPAGAPREAVEVARTHARRGHRLAREAIGATVTLSDADRTASALAREVLRGVAKESERRGVRLELMARSDEALVHDPGAVAQILLNLLLNAVAFSPEGGAVELRVSDDGHSVVFEVHDDGPGISAERAEELFASPGSTRAGGAGIGLRHAAELARRHGGALALAQAGPSACFRLSWPMVAARSGTRVTAAPPRSIADARVLVLEDDVAVRSLIELALEARGAQVLCASNLDELERVTARGALLDAALV